VSLVKGVAVKRFVEAKIIKNAIKVERIKRLILIKEERKEKVRSPLEKPH
jgi:hypothetical protein